ncbi:MAG TPA: hypothetical protein VF469_10450 [Kofleriaceae bacterium]
MIPVIWYSTTAVAGGATLVLRSWAWRCAPVSPVPFSVAPFCSATSWPPSTRRLVSAAPFSVAPSNWKPSIVMPWTSVPWSCVPCRFEPCRFEPACTVVVVSTPPYVQYVAHSAARQMMQHLFIEPPSADHRL